MKKLCVLGITGSIGLNVCSVVELNRNDFELVVQDVCNKFNINENVNYIIHAASNASAWHFEHRPV